MWRWRRDKKPLFWAITYLLIAVIAALTYIGAEKNLWAIELRLSLSEVKLSPADSQLYPLDLSLNQENLLLLVNKERSKMGVAPLRLDSTLTGSAQWKADDEVNHNYFGHIKPGQSVNNGLEYLNSRLALTGLNCSYIGENLVNNTYPYSDTPLRNTATGSVETWKDSETHYQAMIDPKYSLTGFGINGTQVVQHFCEQQTVLSLIGF